MGSPRPLVARLSITKVSEAPCVMWRGSSERARRARASDWPSRALPARTEEALGGGSHATPAAHPTPNLLTGSKQVTVFQLLYSLTRFYKLVCSVITLRRLNAIDTITSFFFSSFPAKGRPTLFLARKFWLKNFIIARIISCYNII